MTAAGWGLLCFKGGRVRFPLIATVPQPPPLRGSQAQSSDYASIRAPTAYSVGPKAEGQAFPEGVDERPVAAKGYIREHPVLW